jgi:nucleoside-diphosphate-sugar epimerase
MIMRDEEKVDFLGHVLRLVKVRPRKGPIDEGNGRSFVEHGVGEDGLPIPPYAVYNIGGGQPENLLDFVNILQEELVRAGVLPADFDFEAHKQLVPMQPGDVPTTYADATALERDFGFTPKITLREGLRKFAEWYAQFYEHE